MTSHTFLETHYERAATGKHVVVCVTQDFSGYENRDSVNADDKFAVHLCRAQCRYLASILSLLRNDFLKPDTCLVTLTITVKSLMLSGSVFYMFNATNFSIKTLFLMVPRKKARKKI